MRTEPDRRRRNRTARELAEAVGRSPRWVQYTRAEERAVYEDRARERRERIVELHRLGLSGRQIAAELGVSGSLVSTRLKEARLAGVDLSRLPDVGQAGSGSRAA